MFPRSQVSGKQRCSNRRVRLQEKVPTRTSTKRLEIKSSLAFATTRKRPVSLQLELALPCPRDSFSRHRVSYEHRDRTWETLGKRLLFPSMGTTLSSDPCSSFSELSLKRLPGLGMFRCRLSVLSLLAFDTLISAATPTCGQDR